MAGGLYGADVAQLRDTAAELSRGAERLSSLRSTLTSLVAQSPWSGPDAARFRSEWEGALSRDVLAAAQVLREAAATLSRNAADQEATSAADGGGTGAPGAGAPGSGTPSGPFGGSAQHPPAGADAADVTRWWDSLTPAQQQALLRDRPDLLGTTDGIPAAVRDEANRAWLQHELDRLEASEPPRYLTGTGYPAVRPNPAWDAWDEQRKTLENVEYMLGKDPTLSLLLLDTSEGRIEVALATGDVDAADHVGVYTQGLFSNTADADGVRDAAANVKSLDQTAREILVGEGRGDETTAMVMWMGYDSPQDVFSVLSDSQAKAGADSLASFADGIRSTNPDVHLSGLGHSYGSTVTGLAATETSAFDSVALFGSPGIDAVSLDAVNVDDGGFYVLANPGDPVAGSGWFSGSWLHPFGGNPADLSGAQVLSTAASDGLTGAPGRSPWELPVSVLSPIGGLVMEGAYALDSHTQYLVDQSTSQQNLAAVVVGADDWMIR